MSSRRSLVIAFAAVLAATLRAAPALALCSADAECTSAPFLVCDPLAGSCVECVDDAPCGGRVCERSMARAAYGRCVQCSPERSAACRSAESGARCLSGGSCGCASDVDCQGMGARVCRGGECAPGCRAAGVPCPDAAVCDASGAEIGHCVAAPLRTTTDAAAPTATAPLPLAPGGGCALGPVGAARSPATAPVLTFGAVLVAAAALRSGRKRRLSAGLLLASLHAGCSHAPTPLRPGLAGSVGLPHRGVLVGGERVEESAHLRFLRKNDRRYATPRFATVLTRAADHVARARPGAVLVLGDLSAPTGGVLLPHLSHRSGRDADILLYLTTLDGAPVTSPGFVHVREDGLAWDERGKRFLRFDVARQWLLLRALLSDDEARVQFVFASRRVRAMLLDWAVARGEPDELVYRALSVLVQPSPGGEHDDHFHVRTACDAEEVLRGCIMSGPVRAWLAPATPGDSALEVASLVQELARPASWGAASSAGASEP